MIIIDGLTIKVIFSQNTFDNPMKNGQDMQNFNKQLYIENENFYS